MKWVHVTLTDKELFSQVPFCQGPTLTMCLWHIVIILLIVIQIVFLHWNDANLEICLSAFTCSKSTQKIPEQYMNAAQS